MSSLVKGLLVKVPSNYNQPVLADGQDRLERSRVT